MVLFEVKSCYPKNCETGKKMLGVKGLRLDLFYGPGDANKLGLWFGNSHALASSRLYTLADCTCTHSYKNPAIYN